MPVTKLRQHLARGEYVQARREAEELIHLGELSGVDLALAYRGAALAYYHLQDVFAAAKLGEKALEVAVRAGDTDLVGKVRYELGEFYLTIGDTHLALQYLQEALRHLPAYADVPGLEARAYHNLALIYRQRRQYNLAVAYHNRAALLFQDEGNIPSYLEAVRGIVWCHLTAGNPSAAWPYLQQLSRYVEQHEDDSFSVSLLTDLAYYYRMVGDIATSTDFCEEALVPGRPGVDDFILATGCIITAENALDTGHEAEGVVFANLAAEYALKAKHPFLMNRASSLLRRTRHKAVLAQG